MQKVECRYCFNKHSLFYFQMRNRTVHLCYVCPQKVTKIQPEGIKVYVPFVANLNLPIIQSRELTLLEKQVSLF